MNIYLKVEYFTLCVVVVFICSLSDGAICWWSILIHYNQASGYICPLDGAIKTGI